VKNYRKVLKGQDADISQCSLVVAAKKNKRVVDDITGENTSLKEQVVKWQTQYHGNKLCICF